jgi:hypothetical protein
MNTFLPMIMLLVNWTVDTNDPENQSIIFKIFVAVHALLVVALGYLATRILFGAKQEGNVVVPVQSYDPKDKGKTESVSIADYDTRKLRELCLQKILMPLGITMFIFSKWGTVLPLLFQCVNNPQAVYKHELFQIYVLGKEPKFELARPWTEPNPMPDWLQKFTGGGDDAAAATKDKKKH